MFSISPIFKIDRVVLKTNIHKARTFGILVLFITLLFSCSPAKYVPRGEYLLSKNHIETKEKSNITKEQIESYIVQTPNKRMIGTRFYLFLYNLSNLEKEKWPHNWLRKIGEEPVIFDSSLTKTSVDQIGQFLTNKGYYKALVDDTVRYKKRNALVTYLVEYNEPYRIKSIRYVFEDTALASVILTDTINSLITRNKIFDKDQLGAERVRIESLLKEKGYFNFAKEYIYYEAVTDPEKDSVGLTMYVTEYEPGEPDPHTKIRLHPKYRIRNVFVYPDLADNLGNLKPVTDTNFVRNIFFVTPGHPNLKANAILNRNYILPGEYYKLSDVNRTYRNLSALSIIRFTNITFKEADTLHAFGTEKYLDGRIELTQKKLQSFQFEIAGTNSSGDLGVRGSLLYSNFNLFRGAEVLNVRFTGAIESLKNQTAGKFSSMKETGTEASITFPKFFAPFRFEGFVKKFAPKTLISASFNFQNRPDFTRSIANGSFAYRWSSGPYLTHSFFPLELSYIRVFKIDYTANPWLESIKNTPLGYSFENHVINDLRYSLELNNQTLGKSRNFVFTRLNLESAGFFLHLGNNGFKKQNPESLYTLFNVPYFQYFMGDIDLRYYNVIDRQNRVVTRLFLGAGVPYGNSTNLPYEKKYFSGGPNSMRAWNTRDLGPGSYVDLNDSISYFPNKSGDIKLEANLEYRFKLIWKIESAFFVDAGNVWNINKDSAKVNAEFDWNRFHKEIAVAAGLGFRFDFSFFLLRVDVGLKVRDPALPEGDRWINPFNHFQFRDLHWKFGIGYPF